MSLEPDILNNIDAFLINKIWNPIRIGKKKQIFLHSKINYFLKVDDIFILFIIINLLKVIAVRIITQNAFFIQKVFVFFLLRGRGGGETVNITRLNGSVVIYII